MYIRKISGCHVGWLAACGWLIYILNISFYHLNVEHNKQIYWSYLLFFVNLFNQLFFIIQRDVLLCTTNFLTSHKNQHLLLALSD